MLLAHETVGTNSGPNQLIYENLRMQEAHRELPHNTLLHKGNTREDVTLDQAI